MAKTFYNQNYYIEHDVLDIHLAESLKIFFLENGYQKILDIGCGTGQLVKFFNEQGFTTQGCDKFDQAIKIAKKQNHKGTIFKASADKLPFKDSQFDCCLAISLIEHLNPSEAKKLIAESYRVLKPGGAIFLVTPNLSSPFRIIRGKNWFGYSDPTHINFFTPNRLTKSLMKMGFEKVKLRFKSAYNLEFDWYLPLFLRNLPTPLKNLISFLVVSSYLSKYRDAFWIAAQKPKK